MLRTLMFALVLLSLPRSIKAQVDQQLLEELDDFLKASEVVSADDEAFDVIAETVKTSVFGAEVTPIGKVRWRVQVDPDENEFFAVKITTRESAKSELGSISTISAFAFKEQSLRCWNGEKLVANVRVEDLRHALQQANVPDYKKVVTENYPRVFLEKLSHSALLKTAATSFSLERFDRPQQIKFVMKNCGDSGNRERYTQVVCIFNAANFVPESIRYSEHGPPYTKAFVTYECDVLLAENSLPKVVSTSETTIEETKAFDTDYRIVFVQNDTSLIWVNTGDAVSVSQDIHSLEQRKNFVMEQP